MHQVRICYLELITKCALSVLDADLVQTYCRLVRFFETKSRFSPFWRARPANTIGSNATELRRPRDLARHRQVPKRPSSQLHVSARHGTAKMKNDKNSPV